MYTEKMKCILKKKTKKDINNVFSPNEIKNIFVTQHSYCLGFPNLSLATYNMFCLDFVKVGQNFSLLHEPTHYAYTLWQ